MTTSRRAFVTAIGAAALVAGGRADQASAEGPPVPPAEIAPASAEEGELKIVNFDLLEEQAKKILPPGRFAFMGPSGDGIFAVDYVEPFAGPAGKAFIEKAKGLLPEAEMKGINRYSMTGYAAANPRAPDT